MIRPSRETRGPDPMLNWKVGVFFLGATLAFIGIGMEISWLVGLAIGVLVLGVAVRFLPQFRPPAPHDPDD